MTRATDELDRLLAEQIAYYRARAPEYFAGVIPGAVGGGELEAALDAFRPAGDERVRFIRADLFGWRPDRRYDVVFFGFSTIRRRLADGTPHRAVKVPHEATDLERRLRLLGWDIAVTRTSGPFYWGAGRRAALTAGQGLEP